MNESAPRHQPFEARVAPERCEVGINPEPPRREPGGDLEQRLELVESLLGLPHQQVDSDELVLLVGPNGCVPAGRPQCDPPPTFLNRLSLSPQARMRQAPFV